MLFKNRKIMSQKSGCKIKLCIFKNRFENAVTVHQIYVFENLPYHSFIESCMF